MSIIEKGTSPAHESFVVEAVDGGPGPQDNAGSMPTVLSALGEDEYKKAGRGATTKMNIIILPSLITMYFLNYLDRNNIASAKLAGIMEHLNLTETNYQSCVAILFVGYSKYHFGLTICNNL